MNLDPVIVSLLAATLAAIFAMGAWEKLRDPMSFEIAVDAYELGPQWLSPWVARLLPMIEITAAGALLFAASRTYGVILGLALMLVVTSAVAINLMRGRTDVGCGCGGVEDEQLISWALVARNAILGGLLLLCLAEPAARPLHWFDYLSVGAGTVCAYGLYILYNQLIANQPRLGKLRVAQ